MEFFLTRTFRNNEISKIKKTIWDEFYKVAQEIMIKQECDILDANEIKVKSNIFNIESDDNWLGTYQAMRSPGVITFNKKLIIDLSKEILIQKKIKAEKSYDRNLGINDAKRILFMVFDMVLNHELFHYFCDVLIPFKYHKTIKFIPQEEALAVSFSYLCSRGNNNYYNSFNKYDFRECFFDKLKSVGYKDWINFAKYEDFVLGTISHIHEDSDFNSVVNYFKYVINQEDQEEKNAAFMRFQLLIFSVISNPNVVFKLV
jgi:hypothetical protein